LNDLEDRFEFCHDRRRDLFAFVYTPAPIKPLHGRDEVRIEMANDAKRHDDAENR
jgi:hypothetical protein